MSFCILPLSGGGATIAANELYHFDYLVEGWGSATLLAYLGSLVSGLWVDSHSTLNRTLQHLLTMLTPTSHNNLELVAYTVLVLQNKIQYEITTPSNYVVHLIIFFFFGNFSVPVEDVFDCYHKYHFSSPPPIAAPTGPPKPNPVMAQRQCSMLIPRRRL